MPLTLSINLGQGWIYFTFTHLTLHHGTHKYLTRVKTFLREKQWQKKVLTCFPPILLLCCPLETTPVVQFYKNIFLAGILFLLQKVGVFGYGCSYYKCKGKHTVSTRKDQATKEMFARARHTKPTEKSGRKAILSTCCIVNLPFCKPGILSTCHFVQLLFTKWQGHNMTSWLYVKLTTCQVDHMASWQNDWLTKWQVAKMSKWQVVKMTSCLNDKLSKWQVVKMTSCQNDKLSKWQVDKMIGLQNDKLPNCQNDKLSKWQVVKMTSCQNDKLSKC